MPQFWYDANGNMTKRVEGSSTYTQTWDVENRLTVVTNTAKTPNAISRFVYDGDGNRVMQIQISGTQVITTAYAGAMEVQITATQRITKAYYSAGSQLIAMRVYTVPRSMSLTTNASGGWHLSSARKSPMNNEFETYIANAIDWAQEHLGSTDYPFLCLAFVEDAYEECNHVEIFGGDSAQESADEYGAAQNTGEPPLGAFVFYDCSGPIKDEFKNWGHVGLHIGAGQVIHAWDQVRMDHYRDIPDLEPAPGWTKPQYLGWAPVERIFTGYRKSG